MRSRRAAVALLAAAFLAAPGPFAPRADDTPAAEAALASKMAAGELKRWKIRPSGDRDRLAEVRPDPILRYSNPGVGRVYGDVFLAAERGRPRAILVIYKWFSPWTGFEAEMHSLSPEPLEAERDGRVAWTPTGPGLRREDVPDAPIPASTPAERLAQMRAIASGFAGRLTDARVEIKG